MRNYDLTDLQLLKDVAKKWGTFSRPEFALMGEYEYLLLCRAELIPGSSKMAIHRLVQRAVNAYSVNGAKSECPWDDEFVRKPPRPLAAKVVAEDVAPTTLVEVMLVQLATNSKMSLAELSAAAEARKYSAGSVQTILGRLVDEGTLVRREHGVYALAPKGWQNPVVRAVKTAQAKAV